MGLNTAAACGIMANIYYETGFIADIAVGTYYGLFMYYAPLAAELKSWCASNGCDYSTVSGQMAFFKYKMENSYQSLLSSLRALSNTADGAYSAADMFCRQFEKPANTSYEANRRGTLAMNTLFPKYASGTTGGSSETAVSYTAYVTASVLNVRQSPGTSSAVSGSLSKGSSVSVTAESTDSAGGTWCKLSAGGWVSKSYLSTTPISGDSSGSSGTSYTVNATALNVRSGAGLSYGVTGCVYSGATVLVVSESQDGAGTTWCQLSSGGWVSKDYLTTGSSASGTTYTVTASGLNVRSGAGTDYAITGCIWNGSSVNVVATANDASGAPWGQLSSGGWICMEFVA